MNFYPISEQGLFAYQRRVVLHLLQNALFLMLLISLGSREACAETKDLPPDHAIFGSPKVLANRVKKKIGDVYAKLPKELAWQVRFERREFIVGEPISCTLTVTNPRENQHDKVRFLYAFSPPCNGTIVSTVSVWRSRELDDDNWTPLTEVVESNHGYHRPRSGFQGSPVTLQPGETQKFPLLLNTAFNPVSRHWCSGIGFADPGHYRVYIRFDNFESNLPFDARSDRSGREVAVELASNVEESEPDLIRLLSPEKPIVLGPFEVSVLSAPESLREPLDALLAGWSVEAIASDSLCSRDPTLLNRMREQPSLEVPELATLRDTVELSWLRNRFEPNSNNESVEARRARLLLTADATAALAARTKSAGLQQAGLLLHCLTLQKLGQEDEARRRAKKAISSTDYSLSDLEVFVRGLE